MTMVCSRDEFSNNLIYIIMKRKIFYSDDVSILDHAQMVVYLADGVKNAIWIDRYDDTEQSFIYSLDLYNSPSDSWISEDDLMSLNSSCDTNYKFNEKLSEHDQYLFTSDLCWMHGAVNFDSYPQEFLSIGSLEQWLKDMELID